MLLYQKLKEGSAHRQLFILRGGNRFAAASMAAIVIQGKWGAQFIRRNDKLYVRRRKPTRILHGDSNKTSYGNRNPTQSMQFSTRQPPPPFFKIVMFSKRST